MLSLGPQHSFPLSDVFRYLHPETTRDVAGAGVPRRAGLRDALALERDALARGAAQSRRRARCRRSCSAWSPTDLLAGGVPRRRRLPREHSRRSRRSPTIRWSTRRSATASRRRWTSTGCSGVLAPHSRGELRLRRARHARAVGVRHEILNARPYTFLDDAPLEERRSHAVQTRRGDRRREPTISARSIRRRSSGCARKRARSARCRRTARRADDRRLPARRASSIRRRAISCSTLARGAARACRVQHGSRTAIWSRPSACPSCSRCILMRSLDPRIVAPPPSRGGDWDAARRSPSCCAAARASAGPTTAAQLAASLGVEVKRRRRRRCWRSNPRASSCAGASRRRRQGVRAASPTRIGMVRPRAARAHPSLHAEPAARGDRAGQPGRLHALPVQVAACRSRRIG